MKKTKYISTKPLKQWCKARGIDFVKHIEQFPLARVRMYIPQSAYLPKAVKVSLLMKLWKAIVGIFRFNKSRLAISG